MAGGDGTDRGGLRSRNRVVDDRHHRGHDERIVGARSDDDYRVGDDVSS
jgi:hypothetical protein